MARKPTASTGAFESATKAAAASAYELVLFVAGTTPASTRAVQALRAICDEHLAGRYELEIVDVYQQPGLARDAQIVAVPTLLKRRPAPERRILGDLSDTPRVLVGLGLEARER